MKIEFPDLYDDEITEEKDGTFTVSFEPWFNEPIAGIPTRDLAVRICHANYQAMRAYADDAMTEG